MSDLRAFRAQWLIYAVVSLLTAVSPLGAQTAHTCGWDETDLTPERLPRTFESILRHDTTTNVPSDVMGNSRLWITSCDATAARRAVAGLRRAAERERSPVLRAMLGVLLARGPEVQAAGARGVIFRATHPNSNAERDAVAILSDVIRRHRWPAAGEELAALAMATRRTETLRKASESLRLIQEEFDVGILRAEVELALGNHAEAKRIAEASSGSWRSGAQRVIAIADMSDGSAQPGAGWRYLTALEAADSQTLPRFYEDMLPLLVPVERAQFEALPADEHRQWMRRAWEWRASLASVNIDERLTEHFTRIAYAFKHYLRRSLRGTDLGAQWLKAELPPLSLDDRGVVYIRHGAPDDYARLLTTTRDRRERTIIIDRLAWYYQRLGGGRAVLEFIIPADRADYYLADPGSGCDNPIPSSRAGRAYVEQVAAFRSTGGSRSPWGCHAKIAGDTSGIVWNPIELAMTAEHAVLRTESAGPRPTRPINTIVNTYSHRRDGGNELTTLIWANAPAYAAAETVPGFVYRFRLVTSVERAMDRSVARKDTLIEVRTQAELNRENVIRIISTTPEPPPGDVAVRISLSNVADSAEGQVSVLHRSLPERSDAFALSDIIIADTADGTWRVGNTRIAPHPAHHLGAATHFRIVNEIYGLRDEEPYSVTLIVAPPGATGLGALLRSLREDDQALEISYDDVADPSSDGIVTLDRRIATDLKNGTYMVKLTVVRRETGERAETWTTITVEGR